MKRWSIGLAALVAGIPPLSGLAANEGYTPPAARRTELLAAVRAADAARIREQQNERNNLVIVRDGVPAATIVCQGETDAARMLALWINKMSGAELPVVQQDPGDGARIYIGRAALAAGLNLDGIESRTGEGMRVKCDGKAVYLAGQNDDATRRAVGRFLEEEFGCRWFIYTEWGMHYPELRTLTVRPGDFSEQPRLRYRDMSGPGGAFVTRGKGREETFLTVHWRAWMGLGGETAPSRPSGRHMAYLTEEDFQRNPEWFRLDADGQRVFGPDYNIGHPEVRARFVRWAVEQSDGGKKPVALTPPPRLNVGWRNPEFPEDFSPEAVAYDNPEVIDPWTGKVSLTDRFISLANEAARELYKLNPETLHGFDLYYDGGWGKRYCLPPTRPELRNLPPNLAVWINASWYSRFHPLGHPNSPSARELLKIAEGWTATGAAVYWETYSYNIRSTMTPYSRITTWAHNLPLLHRLGVAGLGIEAYDCFEIDLPHLYLAPRLAYDPTLDPWTIMADFWDKAYGPAAEPMEAYWMEIDGAFVNLETESGMFYALHRVFTPERLQKLDGLMQEAAEAVRRGTDKQRYRVDLARRGLTRAGYWRRVYDGMNAGDLDEVRPAFDEWWSFLHASLEAGHINDWERRWVVEGNMGFNILAAETAAYGMPGQRPYRLVSTGGRDSWLREPLPRPRDGAYAGEILKVLPDEWKTALPDQADGEPWQEDYDDSGWQTVRTYSDTRNAQGLPYHVGDIWYRTAFDAPRFAMARQLLHFWCADASITLYVNGVPVNAEPVASHRGATFDVTGMLKPGARNRLAARTHTSGRYDLLLGGILGPVYLIDKPRWEK